MSGTETSSVLVGRSRQPLNLKSILLKRHEITYGSVQYRSATEVIRALRQPGWYKNLYYPSWCRKVLPAVLTVWRLPRVELSLNESEAQAWFGDNYAPVGYKQAGSRWAQAVLTVEVDQNRYLAGRRKQALRTNLRQAHTVGVNAATVDFATFDAAARQILTVRRGAPDHTMAPSENCAYYVANDRNGVALAFAGVANFGNFGRLFILFSLPGHSDASAARYLLHTHLLADQAKRATTYLLCGPAFNRPPGEQYFQHLLGYRPSNLHYHVT